MPVGVDGSVAIGESIELVELDVVLPVGFAASDGFIQRITLSAPGYVSELELLTLRGPTRIAVPPEKEFTFSLSIGFCSTEAKDVCYVDRAELILTRNTSLEPTGNVALRYVPEDPL